MTLLDRLRRLELVVVTGKGGVGKTLLSTAIARLLADSGKRVLLLEVDPRESAHHLLGLPPSGGEIVSAGVRLFLQNLRPSRVLDGVVEERVPVGFLARRVLASPVYRHFADGAPGLKESAVLGHALVLVRGQGPVGAPEIDLVVLDAPATGHGASMLAAPRLVADVIRGGPFGRMAAELAAFLADAAACGVVIAALAEEMPAREALELAALLRERLGREAEALIVNGVYPALPGSVKRDRAGAVALWAARRELNEREMARLERGVRGPKIAVPLFAADHGPDLVAAAEARLADALENRGGARWI